MNIYVAHSITLDYKKELYDPIRNSVLNSKYHFILPHEYRDTVYIVKPEMQNKMIDVVIADLSLPSTGQGIELGWADMLNIPIICIYKRGSKISRSAKAVAKISYEYVDIAEISIIIEKGLNHLINLNDSKN